MLDKGNWPYWSVAALSTSNSFAVAGPVQGCGCGPCGAPHVDQIKSLRFHLAVLVGSSAGHQQPLCNGRACAGLRVGPV